MYGKGKAVVPVMKCIIYVSIRGHETDEKKQIHLPVHCLRERNSFPRSEIYILKNSHALRCGFLYLEMQEICIIQ